MKAAKIIRLGCSCLITVCTIGAAITATKCNGRELVAMVAGLVIGAIVTCVSFIKSIVESEDDE